MRDSLPYRAPTAGQEGERSAFVPPAGLADNEEGRSPWSSKDSGPLDRDLIVEALADGGLKMSGAFGEETSVWETVGT